MRCFNHADVDAVGLCRACAKGLCHDCATDLSFGLACKDKHEPEVHASHNLLERSKNLLQTNMRAKYLAPVFFGISGLVFISNGTGLFHGPGSSPLDPFLGCDVFRLCARVDVHQPARIPALIVEGNTP